MPAQFKPITKQQYLVTIKGLDTYWETCSGVSHEAQTTEYSDGQSYLLLSLVGPRKVADITLTKAFDPAADAPIIAWWNAWCQGKGEDLTISITPVIYCPDPTPIGKVITLYDVKPKALKFGEVDKKSQDVSMIELVLTASRFTYA